MKQTFQAIAGYLKNKVPSLIVTAAAYLLYILIPSGWPFVELAYTACTVLGVTTLAPVLRMLVFGEAAHYAECGDLDRDLATGKMTPALIHYWIATVLCYIVPLACIATIAK